MSKNDHEVLKEEQLEKNTLVVVTSDHGDMLFSQGLTRKLYPFEESVRIPFVLRDPDLPTSSRHNM
jgi:arylsulfatase A-like enzyme